MLAQIMEQLSRMAWNVIHAYVLLLWNMLWPLAIGFLLSAWVRTRVPATLVTASLGRNGPGGIVGAAVFGAVSSVCNFAVVGMSKTLRDKGATWPNTLVYMLASTNFGITMLLAVYGFLGGQVLGLMAATAGLALAGTWIMAMLFLPGPAPVAEPMSQQGHKDVWLETAVHFYDDLMMTRKDILVGLGIAALAAALVPPLWWQTLFMQEAAPSAPVWLWNAVLGVVLAIVTFGCSIGNVALAAVLWWNGVSVGGVMAFLLGSLVTVPMMHIYWRQFGAKTMWKLGVIQIVAVIVAALLVDGYLALEHIQVARLHPGAKTAEGALTLLILNIIFGVVGWAFYGAGSKHSTMKGMKGMGHDMSHMKHDHAQSANMDHDPAHSAHMDHSHAHSAHMDHSHAHSAHMGHEGMPPLPPLPPKV